MKNITPFVRLAVPQTLARIARPRSRMRPRRSAISRNARGPSTAGSRVRRRASQANTEPSRVRTMGW